MNLGDWVHIRDIEVEVKTWTNIKVKQVNEMYKYEAVGAVILCVSASLFD